MKPKMTLSECLLAGIQIDTTLGSNTPLVADTTPEPEVNHTAPADTPEERLVKLAHDVQVVADDLMKLATSAMHYATMPEYQNLADSMMWGQYKLEQLDKLLREAIAEAKKESD